MGIIHHFPEKSNGFVETFLVEEEPAQQPQKMEKAKSRKKFKRELKIPRPDQKTEHNIEKTSYENAAFSRGLKGAERFIYNPRKIAEKKHQAKCFKLHQEKMERFPPLPYRREDTSPEAAKFPLPSEKDKILSFSPSMLSFMPLTVSRIHLSEKASTLSTPVIVSLLLFSNVRTLFVSSCIRHCMRSSQKI